MALALPASSRDQGQVAAFPSRSAAPLTGLGGEQERFSDPSRHILEDTKTKTDIQQCLTTVNGQRVEALIEK